MNNNTSPLHDDIVAVTDGSTPMDLTVRASSAISLLLSADCELTALRTGIAEFIAGTTAVSELQALLDAPARTLDDVDPALIR